MASQRLAEDRQLKKSGKNIMTRPNVAPRMRRDRPVVDLFDTNPDFLSRQYNLHSLRSVPGCWPETSCACEEVTCPEKTK